MFDSVLHQRKSSRQRALASTISVAVHAAVVGALIWYGTRKPKLEQTPQGVPVAFLSSPRTAGGAAPPAPPPPPAPKRHKTAPKTPVVKKDLVIPKEMPKERPADKPPEPQQPPEPEDDDTSDSDDDSGTPGGIPGGTKGGLVGSAPGGAVGGQPNGAGGGDDPPVFFGEGMTRPVLDADASEAFHWNRAQLDAHVGGKLIAQCIITREGLLKDCKILKRVAQVEDPQVLDYLAHLKYRPATQGGKPLSIKSFTITLDLRVP